MINKLEELKRKTKSKFYKNISNYYDELNIRNFKFEQDSFTKNAQGISKNYYEVLLLRKFLQTKPTVKNTNISYSDFYYIVIKSRDQNKVVHDKYEDKEND